MHNGRMVTKKVEMKTLQKTGFPNMAHKKDKKDNNVIIIILRRCGGVTVLPLAPLEPASAWACDRCGLRLAAEDQQQTLCDALEVRKNEITLFLLII